MLLYNGYKAIKKSLDKKKVDPVSVPVLALSQPLCRPRRGLHSPRFNPRRQPPLPFPTTTIPVVRTFAMASSSVPSIFQAKAGAAKNLVEVRFIF